MLSALSYVRMRACRSSGWRLPRLLFLYSLAAALFPAVAQAQLRIVTYNPTGPPASGMDIILKSMGEEIRNGIAKPIDILLLQEQSRSAGLPNTQAFVDLLNNTVYAGTGITYARGNIIGDGNDTQAIVYRTSTVQLLSEAVVGSTSTSGIARQPIRHRVKPAGYDDSAAFYIYNSHYKASQGTDSGASTSNAQRRLVEAQAIRTNSDALGASVKAIYAGDHNFYDFDADEPAVPWLLAAGNGQANDPVNQIGTWHNNIGYAVWHTQSPCVSGCGAGGGMDDRFDFQFVTDALNDANGLAYIPGSYHTFGNNGSTYNTDINNGNTINLNGANGVTTPTATVLNALATVTDHLPVVADYQLPAIMQVIAGSIPATLNVGQAFSLGVTVSNAASVIAAIGADELTYNLTTSGAVSGSFLNQTDLALGGSNSHMVAFDTATPGLKMGTITVTGLSQDIQNGAFSLPVSYQVLAAALTGDYNNNGVVDAADFTLWRDGGTLQNDPTPGVQPGDYDVWKSNFGNTLGSGTSYLALGDSLEANSAVPEPASFVTLLIGGCLLRLTLGTLGSWTRKR